MCGINGFNFSNKNLIKNMNSALNHRGPDDRGFLIEKKLSLGHTRLSILDLSSAGKQPMIYKYKKRKVAIVFNGEVYNYKEIKKKLKKKGYKFKSETDTEIILASYIEYGFDCVKKFNGMWAFCIYDFNKKIIFLSRDRLGVKPLYYYNKKKIFIFSSEIKGILEHKKFKINKKENINKKGLHFYFSTGAIPSPLSIYNNVYKLSPATNMVFDLKKNKIRKKWKYFHIKKFEPINNKKELLKQGQKLLDNATKIRMRADVPVGAFLSGGLDSSSVVSIMRKFTDLKKLNTFSIGFKEGYDESKYVKIVKNNFKTKHHHKYFIYKDFKKIINKIAFFYDEPFADASCFPSYDVSKLAEKHVKVVLSGDGGDEVFAGYGIHSLAAKVDFFRKIPEFIRKILNKILPKKGKFKAVKNLARLSLLDKKTFFSNLQTHKDNVFEKWCEEKLEYCLKKCNNNLVEAVRVYDYLFNTLADKYLTKVDRASMAHGLEVRSPYLDYRFINYSQKIPTKLKITISQDKILMRDLISKIVPKEISKRSKKGFIPPLKKWIKKKKYYNFTEKSLKLLKKLYPSMYNFYKNHVFSKSTKLNEEEISSYLIKLFLFAKWWNYWVE